MISKADVERFHAERRRHGALFRATIEGRKFWYIGRGAALKALTATRNETFRIFNLETIHRLFGRAVFNLEGDEHLRRRSLWRRLLGNPEMERLSPGISEIVQRTLRKWSDVPDLDAYVKAFMTQICAECILGLRSRFAVYTFGRLYAQLVVGQSVRCAGGTAQERRKFAMGLVAARILRALFCRQLKKLHVQALAAPSILAFLVRSEVDVAQSDIADDLLAFIVAARETTASVIMWLIVELAQRRELQAVLHDECKDLCTAGRPVGLHTRHEVPRCYALIQEVLRVHSPNIFATKEAIRDVEIEGQTIEAGELCAYSPLFEHFDEDLFLCPHAFQEGRFLEQQKARELLAFGTGAHSCLGRHVAESLLLHVLMQLVTHYRVELATSAPREYVYTAAGKRFTEKVALCLVPL